MKYVFVGEGMGVPGLAHEISDEEAAEQGVTELLQTAVGNGSYAPIVTIKADLKPDKGKGSKE
jgi:hypothetical protein